MFKSLFSIWAPSSNHFGVPLEVNEAKLYYKLFIFIILTGVESSLLTHVDIPTTDLIVELLQCTLLTITTT